MVFGADNTETTTTLTITNGATADDKSDDTITMNSTGDGDPYDIQIHYDHLFGTIVPIPTDSPVPQGFASAPDLSPRVLASPDEWPRSPVPIPLCHFSLGCHQGGVSVAGSN